MYLTEIKQLCYPIKCVIEKFCVLNDNGVEMFADSSKVRTKWDIYHIQVYEFLNMFFDYFQDYCAVNKLDFYTLCKKASFDYLGIHKKITHHNFRHTYDTLLLNKGVDIYTVSKMLGHTKIETTMIYAKVLSETRVK